MLNIAATISHLGNNVCSYIFFAHAVFGCDTTPRVFGIAKKNAITKLNGDLSFIQCAKVLMLENAVISEVVKAGEHALVSLYNGRKKD